MELRVSIERLGRTFEMLGYDEFHVSHGRGFSGGIIVAWCSDKVIATILQTIFQFIHLKIECPCDDYCDDDFTVVYGFTLTWESKTRGCFGINFIPFQLVALVGG